MGKKDKAVMAQQKAEFVDGAVANGVKKNSAAYIFELVDKVRGLRLLQQVPQPPPPMPLLAYQTAYLKDENHPVEFLAASMTLDLGNTDKLNVFAQEARRCGIDILPPCVNASHVDFKPENGAIRYSMAALKSLGRRCRRTDFALNGRRVARFQILAIFSSRLDPRSINKRGLEVLAAAGAFETLMPDRALVHMNADIIMGAAQRTLADRESGQNSLFGDETEAAPLELRPAKTWRTDERLTKEFEAIGFYLSGHPLDDYQDLYEQVEQSRHGVNSRRTSPRAHQPRARSPPPCPTSMNDAPSGATSFAFVGFSDPTGQYEAIIFSEMLNAARDLLHSGEPLLIRVEAKREDDVVKVNAQGIESLDKAAGNANKAATIVLNGATRFAEVRDCLQETGPCGSANARATSR